jgi:hypothetical protein
MKMALKVVSGPLKDKIFEVNPGVTLGRASAGINLEDQRASSVHARIEEIEGSAGWRLIDNDSKNGIVVNAKKVPLIDLTPGLTFTIGETTLEVFAPEPEPIPVPPKKKRRWNNVLADHVEKYVDRLKDRFEPIIPLEPAVVLEFVRGPQVNLRWILGYGPRKVGAKVLDLAIWEPKAPAVCFEIIPSPQGLMFKTDHPMLVRLSGEAIDKRPLRVGDTITINETLIEVDFVE